MAVKAHRLGPGTLKFGETGTTTEFAAQSTNVRLSPSVNEEDAIPVFSGEELDGDDTVSWVIAGTLLQSFDKAGLLYWANTNALTVVPFDFVPSLEQSEFGVRGDAKIVPLEIGGDVKTRNTSDYEFKVIGAPEFYDIPLA
jgi:hypothetical protein